MRPTRRGVVYALAADKDEKVERPLTPDARMRLGHRSGLATRLRSALRVRGDECRTIGILGDADLVSRRRVRLTFVVEPGLRDGRADRTFVVELRRLHRSVGCNVADTWPSRRELHADRPPAHAS